MHEMHALLSPSNYVSIKTVVSNFFAIKRTK